MATYSGFDFIPLKAAKDKRKVTRKRSHLDMKLGEHYPPEGHCSFIRSLDDNRHRLITIGGARRREEATWPQDGSSIIEFIITADDDDVSITSTVLCKTKGGTIPPLHGSTIVDLGDRAILWGGLDVVEYRCRDDLIVLEELPRQRRGTAPLFDVTYIETLINLTPSRRGLDPSHQTGTVPSERTGHTLTKIPGGNKALLFGGLTLHTSQICTKYKTCKDGRFYILDMDTFEWRHVRVPLTQARAYHSASLIEGDTGYSLLLVGGLVFDGAVPSYRESVCNVTVLTMNKNLENYALQEIELDPKSPGTHVFLSSHATLVHNNNVVISGGIHTQSKQITDIRKPCVASSTVFVIDMKSTVIHALPKTHQAPSVFATLGHSFYTISENTFLVVGGSSRQISLLTDRNFEPEACDFEPCTIVSSDQSKDPTWIQCDSARCRKWYHMYCANIETVPEGNYYCVNCTK